MFFGISIQLTVKIFVKYAEKGGHIGKIEKDQKVNKKMPHNKQKMQMRRYMVEILRISSS